MKKRTLIIIRLFIISVLFITLATSCKKDNDDTETVTDIDGNVYNTVTIGTQVWLKENLKTTKYNDGEAIPLVTGNTQWSALRTPGFCWYDNDKALYGNAYGALYNFYTVKSAKLCPTGWHVPTHAEWTVLTDYLGGLDIAGGKLKETGTAHWSTPNTGATNETGFTAFPSGYRNYDGTFQGLSDMCYWWSSTESGATSAHWREIDYNGSEVSVSWGGMEAGFSVRCLKD